MVVKRSAVQIPSLCPLLDRILRLLGLPGVTKLSVWVWARVLLIQAQPSSQVHTKQRESWTGVAAKPRTFGTGGLATLAVGHKWHIYS